jgi:Glycosyltransferase WbsX
LEDGASVAIRKVLEMDRRSFLSRAATGAFAYRTSAYAAQETYQIGAYYFPNFHVDPRNEKAHGKGWTEWELVKVARPRFPGHQQPKMPLWGFEDESDPKVFAKKIDAAADHGLNHFLFDWYWFDDGPFLEQGLERGYMQASNHSRLKFALMWANHDWVDIHPAKRNMRPLLQYPGAITEATWDRMTDYIVSKYFTHPSYWKIDGGPYFSVYQTFLLIQGLGGAAKTKVAPDRFRQKARAAGFPNLHLNAIAFGVRILPGEQALQDPQEMLRYLGFDSVSAYVWIHNSQLAQFPETEYAEVAADASRQWREAPARYGLPYHPNVTMGWDSSPRCCASDKFESAGYPFMATMKNNTPAAFRTALQSVKSFLDAGTRQPKVCSINAWNEWTEGSYLEPDTVHRMGYLQAIRDVFGS